ncbi:MAG: AMP-binding protein, partial [Oscillospiraceae bacterium]|nr:AMP-binding protein [Oscillospiraceae bacterium]
MKLSYFSGVWQGYDWPSHLRMAKEMELDGVELLYSEDEYSILMDPVGGASIRRSFLRTVKESNLEIPCITVRVKGEDGDAAKELESIRKCIDLADALSVPNVAISMDFKTDTDELCIVAYIGETLKYAEKVDVTLLIETVGIFADTARLTAVLDRFASDNLACIWNLHDPVFFSGETPNRTIQNLGAYVRHVHIHDSVRENDAPSLRLVGDGELPVDKLLLALKSIDYNGHFVLDTPGDSLGLDEPDIVLPYFVNMMRRISGDVNPAAGLYENNTGTGKFIWQKDALLELTFSQVLDKLVDTFPNQYAFRYTTLDYTRTYEEFREDVDTFAQALIALGVKAGDHVAIWATNVPQWYITFWATVKLGAVLVTMNTAYKIAEAEYLLRQSDTHTLVMVDGYKDSDYVGIMKTLCPETEYQSADEPLHCKRLPFLRHIITVESRQKGCLTWDEAVAFSKKTPRDEVYRSAALVKPDEV